MSDEATKWFAGWYATRLHCVSVANLGGTDNAGRAMCGAWVYEKPKTKYAARLLAKGVKRCKHCERLRAELSGARQRAETGQPALTDAEREALGRAEFLCAQAGLEKSATTLRGLLERLEGSR